MMKQRKCLTDSHSLRKNDGPSQGQASDTNQRIKALRQGRH